MTLVRRVNWPSDPFFEMDRLFDRAFGSGILGGESPFATTARSFALDVHGDEDNYYVVAELPGVAKDAIEMKVENAVLSIVVSKGEDAERQTVSRSVSVGDDIDVEKVVAKLENGLLTITLPKAEERRPRKISIE